MRNTSSARSASASPPKPVSRSRPSTGSALCGVGDLALVAAVAAPHRSDAFAACARLVDELKASVPIWKRQHSADGTTEWVGL